LSKDFEDTLDPYLELLKEKLAEAEQYLRGPRSSWRIAIILCYDAIITALTRMVIDKKGIKPNRAAKKGKRLYFDSLVSILKKEGIEISNLTDLEILRSLRNEVVHENRTPTQENAKWAYATAIRLPTAFPPRYER